MWTGMPSVTGIITTEVAMIAMAIEKRTRVPTGSAVPPPACPKTTFGVPRRVVPRPLVKLAVGYGLSAETADPTEQTSGDEAGYDDRIRRRGVGHCITPKRIAAT
jgi:hypothetical protein